MNKILVLTTTYPRWKNDSEPAFIHSLNIQLQSDYEIYVIAPHTPSSKKNENLDNVDIIRVRYLPVKWQQLAYEGGILPTIIKRPWLAIQIPFLFIAMLVKGIYIANTKKIDIIHAHWVIPQGLMALIIRFFTFNKIRIITTSHGTDLIIFDSWLLNRIKQLIINTSDRVTVMSQDMKNYCRRKLSVKRQIEVLPMGIDCQKLFIKNKSYKNRKGVVYVGRLVATKGVKYLVEAFSKYLGDYPDEILTIIGDGTERASLEFLVNKLAISNNVLFSGAVTQKEVADMLNQSQISVIPSLNEGFGLVIAESISCGCITLVSDLPTIQDVHNDKTLQFRKADSGAIYNLLCSVKNNPKDAIERTKKLRKRIYSCYDWSKVGDSYKLIFQQLMAGEK